MDVLLRMERVGSPGGSTTMPVEVTGCGELSLDVDLEQLANEERLKRITAERL
jgi:hypothetical protein